MHKNFVFTHMDLTQKLDLLLSLVTTVSYHSITVKPSCFWQNWTNLNGFCTMKCIPKDIPFCLWTQGVQEQARKLLHFCSTLFVSEDTIIHINLHTMLDTALAYTDR